MALYEEDRSSEIYSYDTSTILDGRRARQLAADDATRLYNRVRQLQKEDEKAQRRIEETKKKSREILKLRERNDQKMLEKEMRIKEIQDQIEYQRVLNTKEKEERSKSRRNQEERVFQDKLIAAQSTKDSREQIAKQLKEAKTLQHQKAVEQKEIIKKNHREAEVRITQLKSSKLQQAHDDYDRRLREEMEAKLNKEREILKLAELEFELIERLREKQQLQEEAYEQLESVMALGNVKMSSQRFAPANGQMHEQQVAVLAEQMETMQSSDPSDEDLASMFHGYDTDEAGVIPVNSLQGLLCDLGMPLMEGQLQAAVQQLDPTGSGSVSFGEFFLWWKG